VWQRCQQSFLRKPRGQRCDLRLTSNLRWHPVDFGHQPHTDGKRYLIYRKMPQIDNVILLSLDFAIMVNDVQTSNYYSDVDGGDEESGDAQFKFENWKSVMLCQRKFSTWRAEMILSIEIDFIMLHNIIQLRSHSYNFQDEPSDNRMPGSVQQPLSSNSVVRVRV
jgi:hypothetical protein